MFPHLPSCTSDRKVVVTTVVDEACQANCVVRAGMQIGVWLDDTTPHLEQWVSCAVAKYGPLHQKVFVCIPPGRRTRHPGPTIVNVQEWYPFGMGCPPSEWGPIPPCEAYCLQRNYPGTHAKTAPTPPERKQLLEAALKHHPAYVFQF